jgi:small-conductance mechanosensitive channel
VNNRQRTLGAVTRALQHDCKIALVASVIAVGALIVGSVLGSIHGPAVRPRVVVWVAAVVLAIFGAIAIRRMGAGLGHLMSSRPMPAAGAAVRLVTTATGYVIVICAELGVLDVSIEHLLIGAALAGIVLGIAAQQSLGNVFASVVLLLAKPFSVGQCIRIRSGAMGGIFDGTVLGVSLAYVTISTDDGIVRIPTSVMLATAAGPIAPSDDEPAMAQAGHTHDWAR